MKMRDEEQTIAIAGPNDADLKRLVLFIALPDDAIGLDGIDKSSCYNNAVDCCADMGITTENGFTDVEISNAMDFFTVATAKVFELI